MQDSMQRKNYTKQQKVQNFNAKHYIQYQFITKRWGFQLEFPWKPSEPLKSCQKKEKRV